MTAGLAIRRYRARLPAQAEPVAARLALQALAADLEDAVPRSLPPQALLWLRRVSVQLPPQALRRLAAARDVGLAQGREQIDAALARAARPALGPVPADAEAVLFADEAEMLACLALAAQVGLLDRWWWRGLLGARWPVWQAAWAERPWAQAAAQQLLRRAGHPQAVPAFAAPGRAAHGPLAGPGRSATSPAVAPVAPDAAGTPLAAGALSTAVPGSQATAASARPAVADAAVASAHVPGRSARAAWAPAPADGPVPRAVAPADAGRLAPAAPAPGPQQRPRRDADREPAAHAPVDARPPPPGDASDAAPPAASGGRPVEPAAPPPIRAALPAEAPQEATGPVTTPEARQLPAAPGPAPTAPRADGVDPVTHARSARPHGTRDAPVIDAPMPAADSPVAWPWPQACLSHQGPLLFLVNALLEDGLYPDFTRPMDAGLPVPLWALLGALAQVWRLPPDPLQTLLAEQSGGWRPEQLTADLPAVPGVPAGPWCHWLPAYARCLRKRLCRRLGLPARRWAAALHRVQPGRLWVSAAAWDLEFDLAGHDVAWRLAGLDRDPGWLPTADVSLRFRFS